MAIEFDLTDDYVDCGSAASLDSLTQKTWFARVKFSDGTKYNPILDKKFSNDTTGPEFYYENGSLVFADNAWSVTRGEWHASVVLNNNQYYTLAVTYDAGSVTNDPLIYVDAVSQTVVETSTPSVIYAGDAVNSFRMSAVADGLSISTIAEVWVTNTLVSGADMTTMAGSGYGSALGLLGAAVKGYWGMNDGPDGTSADGDNVADTSGNSNNGTGVDGANNTGLTWRTAFLSTAAGYMSTNTGFWGA